MPDDVRNTEGLQEDTTNDASVKPARADDDSARARLFAFMEGNTRGGLLYNHIMLGVTVLSLVPLAYKDTLPVFLLIDYLAFACFFTDYVLRLVTADYKYGTHSPSSFARYPFSFYAIVDLIAILASLPIMNSAYRMLRVVRLVRVLRVVRLFHYSKNIRIIARVISESKYSLAMVASLVAAYICITALVVFNIEPEAFENYFEALYWSTMSLTTVGYGDVCVTTVAGRIVAMCSMFVGVAVIALPAGVITANYVEALRKERDDHR